MEVRTYSPTERLMRQSEMTGRTKVAPGWHRNAPHKRANGVKTGRATAKHSTIQLTPAQRRQLRQLTLANAAPRDDRALMAKMGTIHTAD